MCYVDVRVAPVTIREGLYTRNLPGVVKTHFPAIEQVLIAATVATGLGIAPNTVVVQAFEMLALGENGDAPIQLHVHSWPKEVVVDGCEEVLQAWMKGLADALKALLLEKGEVDVKVEAEPLAPWCEVYYCTP